VLGISALSVSLASTIIFLRELGVLVDMDTGRDLPLGAIGLFGDMVVQIPVCHRLCAGPLRLGTSSLYIPDVLYFLYAVFSQFVALGTGSGAAGSGSRVAIIQMIVISAHGCGPSVCDCRGTGIVVEPYLGLYRASGWGALPDAWVCSCLWCFRPSFFGLAVVCYLGCLRVRVGKLCAVAGGWRVPKNCVGCWVFVAVGDRWFA